ncbi:SRPBCC family protein [Noviherbaspirillum aridicola]|uniref:Cyclase n=1 Tax=Noviherbaspirillum aridicola TaxID=2849687 RepID=A0ABQ4Q0A5_9BURK|nr:SRPBCC family protein [Noviherbaspirillum aridicola]GIZ50456.1 cyclase [Noviherbaspirillum aridicola]
MARIEQSIDVNLPARALFNQLTRFDDYSEFMVNVDQVSQVDDTHLRWTTSMANRPVVWDAVVTTDEAAHRIAWHGTGGIDNAGELEVRPLGEGASRVVFTVRMESGEFPGAMAGDTDAETSQHMQQSLARLKNFVETQGEGAGASCGMLGPGNVASAASTSGSPTEMLEDEPNESGPAGSRPAGR